MKEILKIFFLLMIISCGHGSFLSRSNDKEKNILFDESMSRHSKENLLLMIKEKNINLQALGSCYRGDNNKGLKKLKDSLNEHIIDERYWNSIGVCYFLDKKHKKAAFFFNLSLQVAKSKNKKFSLPYNNLALIYIHKRQYQLAFNFLQESLKLNKKSKVTKFNLYQLFLKKYLPKKAKPIIEELLISAPKDIELISSLGLTYLMMGDASHAIRTFKRLPEKILKRQDIASYKALSHFLLGHYLLTLEILKKQETITLRSFRRISKRLKKLANEKIKHQSNIKKTTRKRGQS